MVGGEAPMRLIPVNKLVWRTVEEGNSDDEKIKKPGEIQEKSLPVFTVLAVGLKISPRINLADHGMKNDETVIKVLQQ